MKKLEMSDEVRVLGLNVITEPTKNGEHANIGRERVRTVSKLIKKLEDGLPDFVFDNIPVVSDEEFEDLKSKYKEKEELNFQLNKISRPRLKERQALLENKKTDVYLENIEFDTLNRMSDGINWNNEGWKTVKNADKLFEILDKAVTYDPPKGEEKRND